MVVSASVVYPPDHVAAWELQLAAQHHEFCTAYGQSGKRSRFKIRSMVSHECIWLL